MWGGGRGSTESPNWINKNVYRFFAYNWYAATDKKSVGHKDRYGFNFFNTFN